MKNVTPTFEIVDGDEVPRDRGTAQRRLQRLRALAWFLDRVFRLGKSGRFGVEPLIGLIPAVGDWIGGVLSLYVIYEAARLGLPWRVLGRMAANVLVEVVIGTVPVAGDVFDFFWQANMRNVALVERHYQPQAAERPLAGVLLPLLVAFILLLVATFALGVLLALWLWRLIS